jgi:hypothetical protein
MNAIEMDEFKTKDMKLIRKIGIILLVITIILYFVLTLEFLKQ